MRTIKIKNEKEKSFKDLKNENWLREFELEVTNTGDKSIYYIEITMDTFVKFDGSGPEIVFPLRYGRAELGDIVTKATSDDVPLKPGETTILTVGDATAWERGVREKRCPDSTKFRAEIQVLSFGDGTGYFGTELYPPPGRRKAAANNDKLPQPSKARAASATEQGSRSQLVNWLCPKSHFCNRCSGFAAGCEARLRLAVELKLKHRAAPLARALPAGLWAKGRTGGSARNSMRTLTAGRSPASHPAAKPHRTRRESLFGQADSNFARIVPFARSNAPARKV